MTTQGSAYARFRRALANGNLTMVDAAARELPAMQLRDALEIVVLMAAEEDARFERAAMRWLARLAVERPAVGFDGLRDGLNAIAELPSDRAAARLHRLCRH